MWRSLDVAVRLALMRALRADASFMAPAEAAFGSPVVRDEHGLERRLVPAAMRAGMGHCP